MPTPPSKKLKQSNPTYLSRVSSVGLAIKKCRKDLRCLSQEKVALQLSARLNENVTQSYIAHAENGDCLVSLTRFLAICDILEVDPNQLLSLAKA